MKVIKFSAEWCGPCKRMKPIFEEVAKEMTDIEFIDVDIDGDDIVEQFNITPSDLTIRYQIRNIPAFVVIDDDGNEKNKFTGSMSKNDFVKQIEKAKGS